MKRTVTRLFDSYGEGVRAVQEIERMGVPHNDVSLVANNEEGHHKEGKSFAGKDDHGGKHDDERDEPGKGVSRGATTGGLIGGGAGLLAGLGMLAIPGLGPVVAAGWLASTAAGAAAGALGGAAAGGLVGALKKAGHSDEEAEVYAEGVRRGGALVSVQADEGRADQIEQALDRLGGTDAGKRGEAYKQQGWSRFDESAQPYSREQMERERSMYR